MRNQLKTIITLLGVFFGSAVSATTIVQTSSNHAAVQGGFDSFDTSLGTLNSVTLHVVTTDNRALYTDPFASDPVNFSWVTNGNLALRFYTIPNGFVGPGPLYVPITSSGSASLPPAGGVAFAAIGSASFSLDPQFFSVDSWPFGFDVAINQQDNGLFDNLDTTITSDQPGRIRPDLGSCAWGFGDEGCNYTSYTLTYDYTEAVPEPGTWTLMLLGFGAVGMAVRRNRRRMQQYTDAGHLRLRPSPTSVAQTV